MSPLANTGTAKISIMEVTRLAHTNRDTFSHSKLRARVDDPDDKKLIEAKIDEAPAT